MERKTKRPGSLDVKRFCMPYTIKDTCPKCGAPCERDCDEQYFSYPPIGVPFKESLYCGAELAEGTCEHEWEVTLQIDITLSASSHRIGDEKGSGC